VKFLPSKRRILEKKEKEKKREKGREKEKKGSKDWKEKEVRPHMKKLHVSKGKKEKKDKIYKLLEEILSKERNEITFSYNANLICGLIHTHISFIFALPSIIWLFPFLPSFTTPFFINHDYLSHKLSRIFLCFYNIQDVA
jgi:hypothetical protein